MGKGIRDRVSQNEHDIDAVEDRLKALESRHSLARPDFWRHPGMIKVYQYAMWILGLVVSYLLAR